MIVTKTVHWRITQFNVWIWTPSNKWFTGPTRVHNSNGMSIGPTDGLRSWQTDWLTDRPHYSVCNNRPHLCTTATWSITPDFHRHVT